MDQIESDELYELIWQEKSQNLRSYDSNELILLAGQPGCGKTALRNFTQEEFPHDIMVINSDELRERHPGFVSMSKEDPKNAPTKVQKVITYWTKRLIDDAVKRKINILMDGTMSGDVGQIRATIDLCKSNHYRVEVRFLAVHKKISKLGIYLRYEDQLRDKGYGRFVNKFTHDTSYIKVPENLECLYNDKVLDSLKLYSKSRGPDIVDLKAEYGPFISEPLAVFIAKLRDYNLSQLESEYDALVPVLIDRMKSRNASDEYIAEFKSDIGWIDPTVHSTESE